MAPVNQLSSRRPGAERPRMTHIFPRDANDCYVEPKWVPERLFQAEHFDGRVLDPCAGIGRILAAAAAAGLDADGADLVPRIPGVRQCDFFGDAATVPNLVSNPPYAVM